MPSPSARSRPGTGLARFTRGPHPRRPDARPSWAMLPLRAFLGGTFVYAGLQKFADRWFFQASAPSSLQSQLRAAARSSPVGNLIGPLAHVAVPVGLLIAFGEIAIGIGALAGLWTRWAAIGGLVLSTGFLLTVSWHTRPYYYGADIVFVVAWLALIVGGPGPWSIDERTRDDAAHELGISPPTPVSIEFATVQRLCGAYDNGRCTLQRGRPCRAAGCPVLESPVAAGSGPEIERRAFLQRVGLTGWLAGAGLMSGGLAAIVGRLVPPRAHRAVTPRLGGAAETPQTGTPQTTAPPAIATPPTTNPEADSPTTAPAAPAPAAGQGTAIGPAGSVPVGGAAQFTDPTTGDPAFVLQPTRGRFVAFDASCPHQGCPVDFTGSGFRCPCHGATFDGTGAVTRGPARQPLSPIRVTKGADGNLYAG